MTARRARFTQADIARALSGAAKAGVTMAIEITSDGTIRMTPCEARPMPTGKDALRDLIAGTAL